MNAAQKIGDAIREASLRWPRLADAILTLSVREVKGIDTVAADKNMRLYYDPEFVEQSDLDDIVYYIQKDTAHIMLCHAHRATKIINRFEPKHRSVVQKFVEGAAAIAVNEMMRNEGIKLPDYADRAYDYAQPSMRSMEEYFRGLFPYEILDLLEESEDGNIEGKKSPDGDGQDGDGQDGDGQDGDGQDGDGQQSGGNKPGKPKADPPKQSDKSKQKTGSSVDGVPRPWDEPEPESRKLSDVSSKNPSQKDKESGLSEDEVRGMASKVNARHKGRGHGAGEYAAAIDEMREPKINPERLIQSALSNILESKRLGTEFSSFHKPPRRTGLTQCICPVYVDPEPRIAVAIDTSGSMGEKDLELGIGVVARVLKRMSLSDGVRVIAADTCIQEDKMVQSWKQIKRLVGRGGTEMNEVYYSIAGNKKNKPDVILMVTDGETDWPQHKTNNVPLIVCSTRGTAIRDLEYYDSFPLWAKAIFIGEE